MGNLYARAPAWLSHEEEVELIWQLDVEPHVRERMAKNWCAGEFTKEDKRALMEATDAMLGITKSDS